MDIGLILAFAFGIMSIPFLVSAATLDRELQMGMSGSDVSSLQTFLAQDNTIYPQGLVTGYFGSLTKSAVSNFQARNGIATVGRVGPQTLPVINAQMANGMNGGSTSVGGDIYAPVISNTSVNTTGNTANVSWNTNEYARGVVYYGTSYLMEYELPHSVTITGGNTASSDNNLRTSQNVSISGLQSNSTYFYIVYVTDGSGNVSLTLPATFHTN